MSRIFRVLSLITVLGSASSLSLPAKTDPSKVVGPQACVSCHDADHRVWQQTHHAKAFDVLPRLPKAQEFATKMGVAKMKSEGDCMTCHFTVQTVQKKAKAIAGVSCESCHGGAKDWISLHHQKPQQPQAEAAGWVRGSNLHALYSACYECHTAPHEKLVNGSSHPAGSSFELVSWSQGEVRHCYYDGKTNAEATPSKRRILYVLGKSLELEYALRGVSKATVNDTYGQKMALRVKAAYDALSAVVKLKSIPEVEAMLAAVPKKADGSLEIRLKGASALAAAADKIKESSRGFVNGAATLDLAPLDVVLPNPSSGKSSP